MKDVLEVALAAFAHDWGKLLQRAKVPLSPQAQRMGEMLCPMRDGSPTHLHVLHTNDFLEEYLHWLPQGMDRARLQRLASQHHRPSEADEWIIAEADRLASGHDRRPASEEDRRGFRAVPLVSIFNSLRLRNGFASGTYWYRPTVLAADKTMLPGDEQQPDSLVSDYERLARSLAERIRLWQQIPLNGVYGAVTEVSQAHLSFVTASTLDVPDVSLHDHNRLVAALAAALYVYHRDTNTLEERAIRNRDTSKLLLAGGDLSGIQPYLFDIPQEAHKGIARTYRARSFYLSMLTHAAAWRTLSSAGLPSFNCVIDAGGRFVLLLPDTPKTLAALRDVREELDHWMLDRFGAQLTLNLDWSTRASGKDFLGESFLGLFQRLRRALDGAKHHKMAAWLQRDGHWVEDHQRIGYIHTRQRLEKQLDHDVKLGRALPKAHYVGLWQKSVPPGLLRQPAEAFGLELQLFDRLPATEHLAAATDFFALEPANDKPTWVRWRPMANHVPRLGHDDIEILQRHADAAAREEDGEEPLKVGDLATFEHLALLSRRPRADQPSSYEGLPAIACLKADVDRLGLLFSQGFARDVSFGRVASLSRMLDLFFKAFLDAKLSDQSSAYRRVYTVFSGGDDLLLVGPWVTMLDLAIDLRVWFVQLTGGNPDVTLSAGLALGHRNLPMSVIAQAADSQLEAAKSGGRNRVGIFNEVYTWEDYKQALGDGQRLDRMTGRASGREALITPSFLYRLLQYEKMAARVDRARQNEEQAARGRSLAPGAVLMSELRSELTWRSHLAYDLERNVRRRGKASAHSSEQDDLKWLESLLTIEMKPQKARTLRLSATYALYRNRGG